MTAIDRTAARYKLSDTDFAFMRTSARGDPDACRRDC